MRDDVLRDKYGERWLQYRALWDGEAVRGENRRIEFPLAYELQLADSCNLRCGICHSRKRTNEKISKDSLRRIFAEGKKHGLCAVTIGLDSESIIDKELLYFAIDCAKEAGVMDIILSTNGINLTEDVCKKIVPNTTMIKISIDAATSEMYQKIRRSTKFDIVEANVENVVKIRNAGHVLPQIRVSFCKTYVNANEEQMFISKWKDVVDKIDIQNYISTVGEFQALETGKKIETKFCMDPFRRVGILANGNVQCCCCSFGHSDIIIGNIMKDSIYDIWHGDKMKKIQDAFYLQSDDIPNYCKQCLNSRWEF